MKIFLIRHGETSGDIEDRYGGDYDDHLTDKGRRQCSELAEKLKDKGIEMIFHSSRIRAKETAEIVANVLQVKLQEIENIRERNHYGVLTGMVKAEAKEKFPEEVEKLKSKTHHDIKDSEDYDSFKERIITAFDEMTAEHYETAAIVSHGGPIGCIVREVLDLGEVKLGDCCFLEIDKTEDGHNLVSLECAELEKKHK